MTWGWVAIISIGGCNDNIDNGYMLKKWMKELMAEIGMDPISPCTVSSSDRPEPGLSIVRMMATSHIAGHFCSISRTGYITVFSCKKFDLLTVQQVTRRNFDHDIEHSSMTSVMEPDPERSKVLS